MVLNVYRVLHIKHIPFLFIFSLKLKLKLEILMMFFHLLETNSEAYVDTITEFL